MERIELRGATYDLRTCNAALHTLSTEGARLDLLYSSKSFLPRATTYPRLTPCAGRAREALAFVDRFMSGASTVRPDERSHALLLQVPPRACPRLTAPPRQDLRRTYAGLTCGLTYSQAQCAAGELDAAAALLRSLWVEGKCVNVHAVSLVMNAFVSRTPPDLATANALMNEVRSRPISADLRRISSPMPHIRSAIFARLISSGDRPRRADRHHRVEHAYQGARQMHAAAGARRITAE